MHAQEWTPNACTPTKGRNTAPPTAMTKQAAHAHNIAARPPATPVRNTSRIDQLKDDAIKMKLHDSVAGPSSIIQAVANASVEINSGFSAQPVRRRCQVKSARPTADNS